MRTENASDGKIKRLTRELREAEERINSLIKEKEIISGDVVEHKCLIASLNLRAKEIKKTVLEWKQYKEECHAELEKLGLKCGECKWWRVYDTPLECPKENGKCPYMGNKKITAFV